MVSMNFFSFSFLQVFIVFGSSGYLFVCFFFPFHFCFVARIFNLWSLVSFLKIKFLRFIYFDISYRMLEYSRIDSGIRVFGLISL